MKEKLVIYGAGGAAKDIIRLIEQIGTYEIIGIVVDESSSASDILGYEILGNHKIVSNFDQIGVVIANGTPLSREQMYLKLNSYTNIYFPNIVHPQVFLHHSVSLGEGIIIEEGVIITSEVILNDFVYINVKSTIAHECKIGSYVTIAPQVAIAGNVHIGEKSYIGINSTVIERRQIGDECFIAAGATVINNVPSKSLVGGVPAKLIKRL